MSNTSANPNTPIGIMQGSSATGEGQPHTVLYVQAMNQHLLWLDHILSAGQVILPGPVLEEAIDCCKKYFKVLVGLRDGPGGKVAEDLTQSNAKDPDDVMGTYPEAIAAEVPTRSCAVAVCDTEVAEKHLQQPLDDIEEGDGDQAAVTDGCEQQQQVMLVSRELHIQGHKYCGLHASRLSEACQHLEETRYTDKGTVLTNKSKPAASGHCKAKEKTNKECSLPLKGGGNKGIPVAGHEGHEDLLGQLVGRYGMTRGLAELVLGWSEDQMEELQSATLPESWDRYLFVRKWNWRLAQYPHEKYTPKEVYCSWRRMFSSDPCTHHGMSEEWHGHINEGHHLKPHQALLKKRFPVICEDMLQYVPGSLARALMECPEPDISYRVISEINKVHRGYFNNSVQNPWGYLRQIFYNVCEELGVRCTLGRGQLNWERAGWLSSPHRSQAMYADYGGGEGDVTARKRRGHQSPSRPVRTKIDR